MLGNAAYKTTAVAGLLIYIAVTSTLFLAIRMYQTYDDALFIRLGIEIAQGNWLGAYNELTLMKGPIYPIFLALNSASGLPINVSQFAIYYLSSLYLAFVLGRLTRSKFVGCLSLLLLLICPSVYEGDLRRIIRTIFYLSILYVLSASWIHLYLLPSTRSNKYWLALCSGVCLAAAWLMREESLILLPPLVVVFVSNLLLNPTERARKEQIKISMVQLALLVAASLAVFGVLAALNFINYGRLTIVEMKDAAFQRAMVALQRVGGTYERPYVPVPEEARKALYARSPAFARLSRFLDPPDGTSPWKNADNCKLLPTSCGDLAGGWFLWALRDAAGRAGMHRSAKRAAKYYRQIASEVEAQCDAKAVPCLAWLPPLIPPISASQWATFPPALLRGAALLAYIPPPPLDDNERSDLKAPDSAAAIEFLNRPPQRVEPSLETGLRAWVRSVWLSLIRASIPILQFIIAIGGVSLVLALLLRRLALLRDPVFWATMCLASLVASQIFVLALVDISSFPTLYHARAVVAEPFVLLAALLAIHMGYVAAIGSLDRNTSSRPKEDVRL